MQKVLNLSRTKTFETAAFFLSAFILFMLRDIYRKTDGDLFAGIFGNINNSVWEQTKTVYFSYLVASFIEFFAAGIPFKKYFIAKTRNLAFIALSVPAFCFTYTGIAGQSWSAIDISGFITILAFGFYMSFKSFSSELPEKHFVLWLICFAAMLALFLCFTLFAQPINIFIDPQTGFYGFSGHWISASYNTAFT